MRIKDISLKYRLVVFILGSLLLAILVMGITGYMIARDELTQKGNTILKNSVKMALILIDEKSMAVDRGEMTLEQAQEEVKIALSGTRKADGSRNINPDIDLGKNGYYIIYSQDGFEIMHPTLEGEYVWEVKDAGNQEFYLVQDQIEKAKDGGGYTYYS